jgi:hypothetical protein
VPSLERRIVQVEPTGNAGRWNLVEPREEGVDFLNLDNGETLVFWTRWLNSKGKDTIIIRLKRDEIRCV